MIINSEKNKKIMMLNKEIIKKDKFIEKILYKFRQFEILFFKNK